MLGISGEERKQSTPESTYVHWGSTEPPHGARCCTDSLTTSRTDYGATSCYRCLWKCRRRWDGGWLTASGSRRCQERRRKGVAARRDACMNGSSVAEVFMMSVYVPTRTVSCSFLRDTRFLHAVHNDIVNRT